MAKNLVKNVGISIEDALTMAILTPAKLMNMTDRGDIRVGYLADINILDNDLNIVNTVFNGKIVK